MAKWILEPGHTGAEFRVKHMMVSWVWGHFKDIQGEIDFDLEAPDTLSLKMRAESKNIWTGEEQRDKHLRSADFLDVENHPTIAFESTNAERTAAHEYKVTGDLSIRGQKKQIIFPLNYLGKWKTPYWTEEGKELLVTRIGFTAKGEISRNDFGVSWNSAMENNGLVVGKKVFVRVDIEAILETDLSS